MTTAADLSHKVAFEKRGTVTDDYVQTIYDGVEDLERYRQTMENLIAPYRVMSL